MSEQQLLGIPQVGPTTVADIFASLKDPGLHSDDSVELLAPRQARVISADQELVRMRQQGATIRAIARRFRISPERVRQILDRDGW
jgi:DNA-directed RNA polymerase sigma subunit (sigma70/sigma32)